MNRPSKPIRPLLALVALVALGVAASGCGTTHRRHRPRPHLFVQKCGVCHALAQAGTTAQSAPTSTTPSPPRAKSATTATRSKGSSRRRSSTRAETTATPRVSMPADIVTGQDLDDVAAYVGE